MLLNKKKPIRHKNWIYWSRVLFKKQNITKNKLYFLIKNYINKSLKLKKTNKINNIKHIKKFINNGISKNINIREIRFNKNTAVKRCFKSGLKRGLRWNMSRMSILQLNHNNNSFCYSLAKW